jgi:hypothetical protein
MAFSIIHKFKKLESNADRKVDEDESIVKKAPLKKALSKSM